MAATMTDLAIRTLQKLGVIASQESADPADLAKALEKLRAASALLETQRLLRWTEADIPRYAEEPLVMMAASFLAADFERPSDPSWLTLGVRMVAAGSQLRTTDTVRVEYF